MAVLILLDSLAQSGCTNWHGLFAGKLENFVRKCRSECKFCSTRDESFMTMSLQIVGKDTLEDALLGFFDVDKLAARTSTRMTAGKG